jgi:5-methylcytosine-specific restriction endonuclease McrA
MTPERTIKARIRAAKYLRDNPERVREYKRKWYLRNRERIRAESVVYCAANRDRSAAQQRRWREINVEQIRAQRLEKYKNPAVNGAARQRATEHRIRRLQRTPSWLTTEDKARIRAVYAEAARLTLETGAQWHVDHIIPLQGKTVSGLHVPSNLQVLRGDENIRKFNRFVDYATQ